MSNVISVHKFDEIVKYIPSYDYDQTWCTGQCTDYCRCKEVVNTKITSVNTKEIITELCNGIKNEILIYCIDRLVRFSELSKPENWEVIVVSGYYGQETHGCRLDEAIKAQFIKDIGFLNGATDAERIEFILTKEYGYVLPVAQNCTWEIKTIPVEDLILPNRDRFYYVRKMDSKLIESYRGYPYARGVAIVDGSRARLIDGYHRTSANTKTTVTLVVGTPTV